MTLDITDEYFNHHNKKMCIGKNPDSSNFKKPIMTSTPLDGPCSKYYDDSGYLSTSCFTITPLNLNEESSLESILTEKTEKSLDHEHRVAPPSRLDWQEPEEEDVLGKKQLRKSINTFCVERSIILNITKVLEKEFNCQNIIGKKIGRKNCDIVSELDQRNISAFLTQLVGFLSPEDIHCMRDVSKKWQGVCDKINQAHIKLKQFQIEINENRENLKPKCEVRKSNLKPKCEVRKSTAVTRCDLFHQSAASLLNDQHLQKCPKCRHPAKVYPVADKGVCTNFTCNHQYCSKCLANYHGSASCVLIGVKRLPKEILNTKKAKKFLKRL